MARDMMQVAMKGINSFNKATVEIDRRVNVATLMALKENQNMLKREIRKNLRGEPRWNHKGKNRVTGANFDVPGMPRHVARTGGPGRMTGVLYKGVGGVRKPRQYNGTYFGGVGIGAKPNNVKKGVLEAKFPYFAPAVVKCTPLMLKAYEKGWDKAVTKVGGIV